MCWIFMKADKDARVAIIHDGRIFLIWRPEFCDYWELPGGHPQSGHGDVDFLRGRVADWLAGTRLKADFEYYRDKEFVGRAGGRQNLRSDVYFMDFSGPVKGLQKSNWEMAWMAYDERGKFRVAELTERIVEELHKDGRL